MLPAANWPSMVLPCVLGTGRAGTMAEIHIDRMVVHVSGMAVHDAQRLAQAITAAMAQAPVRAGTAGRVETLRVEVPATPAQDVDRLAQQVVAEMVRQVEQTLA